MDLVISSSGIGFELTKYAKKKIVTLGQGVFDDTSADNMFKRTLVSLQRPPKTSQRIVNRHIYLRGYLSPSFLLDKTVSFGTLVALSAELLSGRPPKNTLAFLFSLVYVVKRSSNSVSLQIAKQNTDYYKNKRQPIETYGPECSKHLAMAIKTLNSSSGISPMNELLLESPYVRLISCRF